jgi:prepilin-type N-terminal cleavage/methylation domain-containing protein
MKQNTTQQGFTLVELLVTIAIIAILAGILLPTVVKAFQKANQAKVRTELKSIETAVKAYMNEYSKLPIDDGEQGDPDFETTESYSKDFVIKKLTGDNPRKIVFLESSSSDGTFLNPWDKQYLMWIDSNYDNEIKIGTNTILSQVVVFCKDDGTNVYYSFKQ